MLAADSTASDAVRRAFEVFPEFPTYVNRLPRSVSQHSARESVTTLTVA